jgi:hypothetical protein
MAYCWKVVWWPTLGHSVLVKDITSPMAIVVDLKYRIVIL